eukprot:9502723-Pyramimonas_sp.AAC.1
MKCCRPSSPAAAAAVSFAMASGQSFSDVQAPPPSSDASEQVALASTSARRSVKAGGRRPMLQRISS